MMNAIEEAINKIYDWYETRYENGKLVTPECLKEELQTEFAGHYPDLPSDEEIEKESQGWGYGLEEQDIWIDGAKWIRDKINSVKPEPEETLNSEDREKCENWEKGYKCAMNNFKGEIEGLIQKFDGAFDEEPDGTAGCQLFTALKYLLPKE